MGIDRERGLRTEPGPFQGQTPGKLGGDTEDTGKEQPAREGGAGTCVPEAVEEPALRGGGVIPPAEPCREDCGVGAPWRGWTAGVGTPDDRTITGPQKQSRPLRGQGPAAPVSASLWTGQMLCDGSHPPSLQRAGQAPDGEDPRERKLGVTSVLGLFPGARVHDWDAEGSIVSYLQEAAHGSWPEVAPLGPHLLQRTVGGSPELEEGPGPAAEQSEVGRERRPPGPQEWTQEAGSTFSLQVKVGALGQGGPGPPASTHSLRPPLGVVSL